MLLVHHTVRGARRLLKFPVTVPRNERAIRYSACLRVPFLRVLSQVQCSVPNELRRIWNKSSLFCRCVELYVPWEHEPSALDQLVSTSLLSDPYQGEWNRTNGENPYATNQAKKSFLSCVSFSCAEKTFKNVHVSLICFISISPIHSVRDASRSPSIHSLSPRDTTRRVSRTSLVHAYPSE